MIEFAQRETKFSATEGSDLDLAGSIACAATGNDEDQLRIEIVLSKDPCSLAIRVERCCR